MRSALKIKRGEIRSIGVIIRKIDGGEFEIDGATYEIQDRLGNVLVAEAPVDGWEGGSASPSNRYRVSKTINFDHDPNTLLKIYFWMVVSSTRISGLVEVVVI